MTDLRTTPPQEGRAAVDATLAQRAGLLCVCVVAGLGIGFAGQALSSDSAWFLAVPACMLAGWLYVADPTRCARRRTGPELLRR